MLCAYTAQENPAYSSFPTDDGDFVVAMPAAALLLPEVGSAPELPVLTLLTYEGLKVALRSCMPMSVEAQWGRKVLSPRASLATCVYDPAHGRSLCLHPRLLSLATQSTVNRRECRLASKLPVSLGHVGTNRTLCRTGRIRHSACLRSRESRSRLHGEACTLASAAQVSPPTRPLFIDNACGGNCAAYG